MLCGTSALCPLSFVLCPPVTRVLVSSCPRVVLSSCPTVLVSSCSTVLLSSCRPVVLSSCRPVLVSSCPPVLLSSSCPQLSSPCTPLSTLERFYPQPFLFLCLFVSCFFVSVCVCFEALRLIVDLCTHSKTVFSSEVQDFGETDIDCGGTVCPGCPRSAVCLLDRDCLSPFVCAEPISGVRQCEPTCFDGVLVSMRRASFTARAFAHWHGCRSI